MNDADLRTAERISRLLDGRLNNEERDAVLGEIGASGRDMAVLADAAAVLRELETEGLLAGTAPPPADDGPRRRWRTVHSAPWWLLAASLTLLAGGWWRWGRERDDPDALRARTVLALSTPPTSGGGRADSTALFAEARAAVSSLSAAERATRVGVALADLQLQVAASDPRAGETASRIAALLADLPAGAALTAPFDSLRAHAGAPPSELAPMMRAARAAAMATDSTRLALAEWAELARHAAARRGAAFTRSAYTRQALERGLAELPSGHGARPSLAALRGMAASVGQVDWAVYTRHVAALLRALEDVEANDVR